MARPDSQEKPPVHIKRRRRKADRPGEIITSALLAFAEKGYAVTTMEEVAARAGISKPTIYLYFKTKEDLFEAAILDRIIRIMDQVAKDVQSPDLPMREALRRILEKIYGQLVGTDASVVLRLIVSEGLRFPELRERFEALALRKGREVLDHVINTGRASGELRDAPYALVPEVVISPALVLAMFGDSMEPYRSVDRSQFFDAHLDLVLNGIMARRD